MPITLQRKIVKSWATPHLVPNFMLFQMAALKNSFSKIFQDFELRWSGFLENFLQILFSRISTHTIFDREFQGLSKSLFRFDLVARLHWKISKIQWFYNFSQHCISWIVYYLPITSEKRNVSRWYFIIEQDYAQIFASLWTSTFLKRKSNFHM